MLRMGFWELEGFPQCPSSAWLSTVPMYLYFRGESFFALDASLAVGDVCYLVWSSRWEQRESYVFMVCPQYWAGHVDLCLGGRALRFSCSFFPVQPNSAWVCECSWVPCSSQSGSRHRLGTVPGPSGFPAPPQNRRFLPLPLFPKQWIFAFVARVFTASLSESDKFDFCFSLEVKDFFFSCITLLPFLQWLRMFLSH